MPFGIIVEGIDFSESSLVIRPKHAAVLGRIFTSWSLIESCVTAILGLMMHTDDIIAATLLENFPNNSGRLKSVRRIGSRVLSDSVAEEFDKLMQDVEKYARERNKIAHGLWGSHRDFPDLVYRMPMASLSKFVIESPSKINKFDVDEILNSFKSAIEEFTLDSLEELESRGKLILERVMKETTKLGYLRAANHESSYRQKPY